MLLDKISMRSWHGLVVLCCAGLIGFALYKQHKDFLDPCPLCIIQRVAFIWIGAVALLAALHDPARTGRMIYNVLLLVGAAFGGLVAGRHVWLQHLPPDRVPECGPGLNYMLENFPLSETLSNLLWGSGSCAEVHWKFLWMSMPEWTLTWFVLLGLGTLLFMWRRA
jgi:disulfide bond formation protein DsbB